MELYLVEYQSLQDDSRNIEGIYETTSLAVDKINLLLIGDDDKITFQDEMYFETEKDNSYTILKYTLND